MADLRRNPLDVRQVQIAVGLAGSSDTDEGQIRFKDRLVWVLGCPQPAFLYVKSNDLPDILLDDRGLAGG
jgi:hypothetical protein